MENALSSVAVAHIQYIVPHFAAFVKPPHLKICQKEIGAFAPFASFFRTKSRRRRVYHPQLVAVYHQTEGLDIIKPQVRCTLARDEIQPQRG
jgi:hypothetical protein